MKRTCNSLLFFLSILLGLSMLAGCQQETTQDSQSQSQQDSTPDFASGEPVEQPEDVFTEEPGDENIADNLGLLRYLLTEPDWTAESLTTSQVVMWYAVMVNQQNNADEFYMSRYLVEDLDGFFIPKEELESAAASFFGLDSNELRADGSIYDSESGTYRTPQAIGPLADIEVTAGETIKDGDVYTVNLNIRISDGAAELSRELTFTAQDGHIQYVSCLIV